MPPFSGLGTEFDRQMAAQTAQESAREQRKRPKQPRWEGDLYFDADGNVYNWRTGCITPKDGGCVWIG